MAMHLIGTAGHAGHGKSQLIEALAGTVPAPRPEEHGTAASLHSAVLEHPDGFALGVVDVPGREALTRGMIAGATGVTVALWVVDAREGIAPQSREHLHVLDMLGVRALLPVLTKADLATPAEVDAARTEATELLATAALVPEPFHVVDSVSGRGIEALREALFALCDADAGNAEREAASERPYLPVDRVSSLPRAGTAVTGMLMRGRLEAGGRVALGRAPEKAYRIRSLRSFREEVDAAGPGQRVSADLAGLDLGNTARGDVLVAPGHAWRSRFLNVRVRTLPDALHDRKDGLRVLFHAGCAVQEARLYGLHPFDVTEHGERAWAQLELPEAMAFHPGQRFVLRSKITLRVAGGGTVLDLAPDVPREVTAAERAAYRARCVGSSKAGMGLAEYAAEAGAPVLDLGALARRWMCAPGALADAARASNALRVAEGTVHTLCWRREAEDRVLGVLRPSVEAAPRDEQFAAYEDLRGVSGLPLVHLPLLLRTAFARDTPHARFLRKNTRVEQAGLTIYPGETAFTRAEEALAHEVETRLAEAGREPPHLDALRADYDAPLFEATTEKMCRTGRAFLVGEAFLFAPDAADALRRDVAAHAFDGASVAEVSNALGLSRKHTMPCLRWLEAEGVLHREGDRYFRAG